MSLWWGAIPLVVWFSSLEKIQYDQKLNTILVIFYSLIVTNSKVACLKTCLFVCSSPQLKKELFALTNHKVIYNYYLPKERRLWNKLQRYTLHLTFLKVVFGSLRFHQDQLLLQRITAYFLWNQYLCSHIDLLQIKKLEHNRISTQFLLLH